MNWPRPTPRPFFIPDVAPGKQEELYARFAAWCGCSPVPEMSERIYSIEFGHNGVVWTATVGERLRGIETVTKRSKGKKIERKIEKHDEAVVCAIFPRSPCFRVVTNHRLQKGTRSFWENPFMAGEPREVTYFSGG